MLPFSYALRNLTRSYWRSCQLALGVALAVTLIMGAEAFNRGMNTSLTATINPNNVLLLGAGSEESLPRSQLKAVTPGIVAASIKGIKRSLDKAYVSPEVYFMGLIKKHRNDKERLETILRGVEPSSLLTHNQLEIIDGRFPGPNEVMVGRLAYIPMGLKEHDLQIGNKLYFEKQELTIVGVFQSPGSVLESEIWLPAKDLMDLTRRQTYSNIVITLDGSDFEDVELFCMRRLDLELAAIPEVEYYRGLAAFFNPIKMMIWLSAILISLGSIFGGMNLFFAVYIDRKKEIAALQAIGYSRTAIYFSFLLESTLVCLIGAAIAIIIAVFALNGLTVSFAIGVFNLFYDSQILLLGLGFTGVLAVLGTLIPAWCNFQTPLAALLRS